MRIISAIVAIILLVLAGIPWVDGLLFRQQYLHMVENIAKSNPQIEIKVPSYHVGWLDSDVQMSVRFISDAQPNPSMIAQHLNYTINQHVSHGPFVYDEQSHQWTAAWAFITADMTLPGSIVTTPAGGISFHSSTLATFVGDYISQLNMPAFSAMVADGRGKVSFQGLQGDSIVRVKNGKTLFGKGDVVMNGVSLQVSDSTSMIIKSVSFQYEVTPQQDSLSNGFYSFSIPSMSWTLPNSGAMSVSDFNYKSTFGLGAANAYSNSMQISIGQWTAPVFAINKSSLKISLENMNAKELANFLTGVAALEQQPATPERNDQLIALVSPLFMPNTAVNENTVVTTSFGNATSDGQITWPGGVNTRQDILSHIKAVKNLRMSVSLVNKVIDLMYPSAPSAPPISPRQSSEQALSQQIDSWVDAKKIQIDVGVKLKDLISTHLSADDFATNIDQFVVRKDMPANLAEQMKTQYAAVLAAPKTPVPPPQSASAAQADAMKAKIAGWVKLGYVSVDKDDYVTALTFEQGVFKANGVQVDLGQQSSNSQ